MLAIDQKEFDAITKVRRRTFELPVQYDPEFGTHKRCSVRPGGVYKVRPQSHPDSPKPITITVMSAHRAGRRPREVWVVQFLVGAHRDMHDEPTFLGRSRDYTKVSAQAMEREGEPIPRDKKEREAIWERTREQSVAPVRRLVRELEQAVDDLREAAERAAATAERCKAVMRTNKAKNKIKLIQRELAKLVDLVSEQEAATISASDCADSQWNADPESVLEQSGTRSDVSPLEDVA